jgi:hypothetical protein
MMSSKDRPLHAKRRLVRFSQSAFLLLAFLITLPLTASAAVSPSQPPNWLTYTNSLQAYTLSYPSTWHHWTSAQDSSQYFTTFDPKIAPPDFPATMSDVKLEVAVLQKPATQSLDSWLTETYADLWPGGPANKGSTDGEWLPPAVQRNLTISGHAAMILTWKYDAYSREEVYFDTAGFAYKIAAMWASAVDPQLIQRVLSFFKITGTTKLSHQTPSTTTTTATPFTLTPTGLNLPMQVDYANGSMSSIGMNAGGANSWFDHDGPHYSPCDNSLTRYDGAVYSPNWCSGTGAGSCTISVSCYDGHPGIDFGTGGQVDIPIYASASGTIQYYSDSACGTGLYLIPSVNIKGHPLKILHCHLDSTKNYILPNNSTVTQGQEIALSGCSGTGCGGPHLHYAVYRTDTSPSEPVDPNGWIGGGTDPWSYDIGYLWTTNPASFIGGTLYTVTPTLTGPSQFWTHQASDQYGVASDWTYTDTAQNPTNVAYWYAPVGTNLTCGAVEVWIPTGDATATTAKYIISFTDGAPDKTVTVNQNANTSWYTIYSWYGGDPISQVRMGDNTGISSQKIAAAQAWFSCYTG